MFEFNLTQYKENVTVDPFSNIKETIQKSELLKCEKDFFDYTSKKIPTNTYSMMIQYNYSPTYPVEGCEIDWKIYFYNKYNDTEILDQVSYDIWVVDENNNKLYSYAESIGKEKLYNEFGQVEHRLSLEQGAGLIRYAIFVHGLGPEQQVDNTQGGYAIIEVEVEKNPLLHDIIAPQVSKIPSWIKNNAGWWADSTIDDDSFVSGIEYLVNNGIISVN